MVRGTYDGLKATLDPSHRQQVLQVMSKYLRMEANSPELANTYSSMVSLKTDDPTPELAGGETILKALQSMDATRYSKISLAELIDPSFMERVKAA
jgi:hypothetical protein